MAPPTTATLGFDEDCRTAVGNLRSTLLGLFRALDADPTRPQEIARRFKLDKSLTWKVSKALQSDDAFSAAAALPGASGVGILLDAMRRGGAPADLLAQARNASDEYERVIEIHTGDRDTMRLILDSLSRDERALEVGRRQAFRGNSGIWGIQCQVRVSADFVAPAASNADRLDLGMLAGCTRVRRLRPIASWPILDVHHLRDDRTANLDQPLYQPWGDASDDGGWILRPFCTETMPALTRREMPYGVRYELGDGPVGRTGEFGWYGGHVRRSAVPRFAGPGDTYGQFEVGISLPTETLLYDLFVHHTLAEALNPKVLHFNRLPEHISRSDPSQRLPIAAKVHDLGRHPAVATPLVEQYDRVIASAMGNVGWDLADFHCLRVVYKYPPLLSTIGLRYELPARTSKGGTSDA